VIDGEDDAHRPLPVVLRPVEDEQLSSWLARRSFSDRRASCANPSRWSRTERLLVPSISHLAKNGPVTPIRLRS
jgi:hypothetical protein